MDNTSPEHSKNFDLWTNELVGSEAIGTAPATEAYRRVVLTRDANGVPTYKNPIYVPVDKYGLPVLAQGTEPTESEKLELRWDATLLDYPLPAPSKTSAMPPSTWRKHLIAEVLYGNIRQDPVRKFGVQEWKTANFTPELYALLHVLIPPAVQYLAAVAGRRKQTNWFRWRLDQLGIHTACAWEVTRLELLPSHWADFPNMLFKISSKEAVEQIISLGMPGQRVN